VRKGTILNLGVNPYMKIRIFSTILLSAALAVSAFAADISGKWKATTEFNGQTRENTLNLKDDGATLTGTMENQRGSSEIKDGKIDGNNISFSVVRLFQGTARKIEYKGV